MQTTGRPSLVPEDAPVHRERHRPEQTTLYRLVQQHAATFFAETEAAAGADLPHGVLAPNAKLRAQVVPSVPAAGAEASDRAACEPNCAHHGPVRMSWAQPLKRVFELDLEHCPNCGGDLKIIAAILETPAIERILTHLGLQARAPPRAPARGRLPLSSTGTGAWHLQWRTRPSAEYY